MDMKQLGVRGRVTMWLGETPELLHFVDATRCARVHYPQVASPRLFCRTVDLMIHGKAGMENGEISIELTEV